MAVIIRTQTTIATGIPSVCIDLAGDEQGGRQGGGVPCLQLFSEPSHPWRLTISAGRQQSKRYDCLKKASELASLKRNHQPLAAKPYPALFTCGAVRVFSFDTACSYSSRIRATRALIAALASP